MSTQERRLQRAIDQIGDQQVRSGVAAYLADLSVHTASSIREAYVRDHDIVYKWDNKTLVRRLILLRPKLRHTHTDEEMIIELKSFLRIH